MTSGIGEQKEFLKLREAAREAINNKTGKVPSIRASSVLADYPPSKTKCKLCGDWIAPQQIKYTVSAEGPGMGDILYPMHFLCHAAWQLELFDALRAKGDSKPM